jgi:small subunit ribosomal protein S18
MEQAQGTQESKEDGKESDAQSGKRSFGRRNVCKLCADTTLKIDYKDSNLLRYFVTDRGKLVPRRVSNNCAKHQRQIAVAVKRARMIALMPFSVTGG